MLVVSLVEEHIFAVVSLGGVFFKNTVAANTMLHAKLLPELVANLISTLTNLKRDDFSRHFRILLSRKI